MVSSTTYNWLVSAWLQYGKESHDKMKFQILEIEGSHIQQVALMLIGESMVGKIFHREI